MISSPRKVIYSILALLVSLVAWVFVVYNYYPMTEVKYSEVPISYTGEEALAERGLVVADTNLEGLSVTLNQKRIDTNRIKSEDIEVTADVSNCVAGENSVSLSVVGPKDTTVLDYDRDNMAVNVVRASRVAKEINVVYGEGAPENAEPVAFDLGQTEAEAICADNQMANISMIAAVLNYNEVGSNVKSYTCKLRALDADGNIMPHVTIYPNEISLDASAGFTKEVKLTVPVTDKSDDNYERKYSVPDKITIKGAQNVINDIAVIEADSIEIGYEYESGEIPLEFELPEGVYIANASKALALKLTVSEKPQSESSDEGSSTEE